MKGWLAGVGVLPRERPCNRTQEGEGGAETAVSETSKNLGELHGERGVNVLFFSHCLRKHCKISVWSNPNRNQTINEHKQSCKNPLMTCGVDFQLSKLGQTLRPTPRTVPVTQGQVGRRPRVGACWVRHPRRPRKGHARGGPATGPLNAGGDALAQAPQGAGATPPKAP